MGRVYNRLPSYLCLSGFLSSESISSKGRISDQSDWQYYEGQHGNRLAKLAKQAGITLPRNALRHSFASYAAAKTHDIPRVSMWLGHSGTNMTEKHYREGVRAAEGEAWFKVLPEETSH